MGLEIESEIFKWLQSLKIVKEARRASAGKVELSQHATSRFFDGLYISQIAKDILHHRGEEQTAKKLAAIKENSTPAIRLYNWNILSEALKKLGYSIDYSEKSKLLSLENEPILKIINHLWSIRAEQSIGTGILTVSTGDVSKKTLRQASNIFQFLVISICNHFKLSVQHALNLFLDNNKYLAHLLVKGVKGSYEPILLLLKDCRQQLPFIVDSLLVIDQKENLDLFLGALKPCLISKEPSVTQSCLELLKQFCEVHIEKGLSLEVACNWMEHEGFDTIFFSVKRHPQFFSQSFVVAYAYMEEKLFARLQPQDKSLLWNNQAERLNFYRQLLDEAQPDFVQKFIQNPVFEEWNKISLKSLKRAYTPEQKLQLLFLFQKLWSSHLNAFQNSAHNLPLAYAAFLKNCISSEQEIIFVESTRVIFTLIVQLGLAKNSNAPVLYKTAISALAIQQKQSNIQFMLQGFLQIMRDIPSLPAAPLAEPLLKLINQGPSTSMLGIIKTILAEGRMKEVEKEQLEESLIKIVFTDITFSRLAQEILIEHFSQVDNSENLTQYCTAGLAQFFSIARDTYRTIQELKLDYDRYQLEESMKRGQTSFLRNISKLLYLSNIVMFLQRAIFISSECKDNIQPYIFHTYIRIERQLKRQNVSRLLMPLMLSYYDQNQLPLKLEQYLLDIRPSVLNFQSIGQSENDSPRISPSNSGKGRRIKQNLKTEQSKQGKGINSILKNLQQIKKKREQAKERSILQEKEKQAAEQKKQLYYSVINQKRVVQYGKSRQNDVDYKYLLEFDSAKPSDKPYGYHDLNLLNLQTDEELPYIQDATAIMKKYRKLWRFLFFKFSSCGLRGHGEGQQPEQKINGADILKFLKDYQLDLLSKEKVLALIKRVNETQKRKSDPSSMTYLGFEEYILQYCYIAFGKQYPQNPPGRQILHLVEHLRSITGAKGGSTDMFDSPQQMYFQQTQVIRQFNRRLSQNPDYPLPQGYKKVRQVELKFHYSLTDFQKGVKPSYQAASEVLDDILFNTLGFRMLQPLTTRDQKCLARPVLFQKIKEKMKDYSGGYMIPKRSAYLPRIEKESSPAKPQFHLFINFSLGIRLGIAGTSQTDRVIAEEVAYWLDDALDAVDAGKLKVGNKSKTRVQNQLIRRKRSEALQYITEKQEQQMRQRIRAQTLKHQTQKFQQDQKEKDKKKRQQMKLQRQKRKEREELMIQKKKIEFAEAKNKLQAKRKQVEDKKIAQLELKKKQKEQYKKNVEEYFKKKKEELEQQERSIKSLKEQQNKEKEAKKIKQEEQKRKIEIEVFKKQQVVLEKLTQSKRSYEEVWKSRQIQQQLQKYRPGLKLIFDLLVKYEKSKISTTGPNQISLNTLNFYSLKSKMVPLLIGKTAIALLFRTSVKKQARNGLAYNQFQELLFKIAVKGKHILNSRKSEEEGFQMVQEQSPNLKGSRQLQSPSKKNLTDQYTFDASGVTQHTLKRLLQYLNLPEDKLEADQKFRQLLQSNTTKPAALALKEARSLLDSTVI